MNTKALESAGFTKGEVNVYLSLLDLGETTTGPVIKRSGITGSKVYEILDKLIKKGIVSYIVRDKTKYFQASPPRKLLDYMDTKEKEFRGNKKKIEEIIPDLEDRRRTKEKTQTSQIFEGYEGIKSVFNMVLETMQEGEEYYGSSLGEELIKRLRIFLLQYHRKRIKKGVKVKLIVHSKEKSLFREFSKLRGLQMRYYHNPYPVGMIIFKNTVASFTFKEKPTAFLIRSSQIAESYKNFFMDVWSRASSK
jgi:sugar-specific transcriptional regulator TrmB